MPSLVPSAVQNVAKRTVRVLLPLPLADALEAEQRLAAALGGDVGAISALRVLQLYLERLGCTLVVSAPSAARQPWSCAWCCPGQRF